MNNLHRTFIFSLASMALATPLMAVETAIKTEQSGQAHDTSAWRASDVIGSSVKNSANEEIGEIEDLLIDSKTGKISSVIISTGGFLGVADTLSSVPVTAFRYDEESKSYRVALSKEELASGEKFTTSEWKAGAATKLKAARDAIGGDVSKPDNSAKNERDMGGKTATPGDQGNSEGDLKLTKDIRSAVVASDLSFNAKNIKIISNNGQVVLRGVVDTTAEHQEILKLAKAAAGSAVITDQLEVKK
jgi:sporulation protein YlmC with PRC-barrel domain